MRAIRDLIKKIFTDVPWSEAKAIAVGCRLINRRNLFFSAAHIIISGLNAATDGTGLLLLLDLVTKRGRDGVISTAVETAGAWLGIQVSYTGLYAVAIALIFAKVLFTFTIAAMDGYLEAIARREIQNFGFSRLAGATWESLRNIKVGERLGAVTEESAKLALFYASIVRALYSFGAVLLLCGFALHVSLKMSAIALAAAVPSGLALRELFNRQSRLVKRLVSERQALYSALTERLNSLFHIKADGNLQFHIAKALHNQAELTRLEIEFWYCRAYISGANTLLPALVLLMLYAWTRLTGASLSDTMYYLAGIGVIGTRILAYANVASSNLANITGLSGSIPPVYALAILPQEPERRPVPEQVTRISALDLSYKYNSSAGIKGISLEVSPGRPLLITGPSGCGKTTLANLISGILPPNTGQVLYIGGSGKAYDACGYRARISYVTQDVTLFNGTVRDNLLPPGMAIGDKDLTSALKMSGAEDFIAAIGGLDARIAESGRSLSGGQKRRLAIARAIASKPQIMILDEITSGLDDDKKAEIVEVINSISEEIPVVIISHEKAGYKTGNKFDCSRKTI